MKPLPVAEAKVCVQFDINNDGILVVTGTDQTDEENHVAIKILNT